MKFHNGKTILENLISELQVDATDKEVQNKSVLNTSLFHLCLLCSLLPSLDILRSWF